MLSKKRPILTSLVAINECPLCVTHNDGLYTYTVSVEPSERSGSEQCRIYEEWGRGLDLNTLRSKVRSKIKRFSTYASRHMYGTLYNKVVRGSCEQVMSKKK